MVVVAVEAVDVLACELEVASSAGEQAEVARRTRGTHVS